MPSNPPPTVAK